jgi:hypothetical protein
VAWLRLRRQGLRRLTPSPQHDLIIMVAPSPRRQLVGDEAGTPIRLAPVARRALTADGCVAPRSHRPAMLIRRALPSTVRISPGSVRQPVRCSMDEGPHRHVLILSVMTRWRRPSGKARFMSYAKRPLGSSLQRDDATAPRAPYAQRRHNPRRSLAITGSRRAARSPR